jgi:hypothetical protein
LSAIPLAAALALAGCGQSQPDAAKPAGNDTDPALTSALEDQILVDPALTQQSNKNAVRPSETPAQAQYPADSAGRAGVAERARRDLWDGGGAGCGNGPFNYDPSWAGRLPPAFPLPPGAKLTEAAGHNERGCAMRVVTFAIPQPANACSISTAPARWMAAIRPSSSAATAIMCLPAPAAMARITI